LIPTEPLSEYRHVVVLARGLELQGFNHEVAKSSNRACLKGAIVVGEVRRDGPIGPDELATVARGELPTRSPWWGGRGWDLLGCERGCWLSRRRSLAEIVRANLPIAG